VRCRECASIDASFLDAPGPAPTPACATPARQPLLDHPYASAPSGANASIDGAQGIDRAYRWCPENAQRPGRPGRRVVARVVAR
jgi:hypothetical protein